MSYHHFSNIVVFVFLGRGFVGRFYTFNLLKVSFFG